MDENLIVELEKAGIVTATFRKLAPKKKVSIYRAALNAFAAAAVDRVGLDQIAAAAKISKGSLFQYFVNKDNLLAFVAEVFFDEYQLFWEHCLAREYGVRVRDRMLEYIGEQAGFWGRSKTEAAFCMKMLFQTGGHLAGQFKGRFSELHTSHVADIIERGIKTGEVRRDVPKRLLVELVLAVFLKINRDMMAAVSASGKSPSAGDLDSTLALLFSGISG
ncbi:MAG: TetR/AcrR family transcriptional regulator [Candidatus Zixiibacteriota bacterium]|nr:MAG: TetR/AcrR family transcriptional regulator [candidate division Zixibacteria bacterium]